MLIATAACTSAFVDIAMAQEEPTAPELQREHSYPAPPDGAPQPPQEAPSSLDRESAQPPAPQLPLALQELPLPEDELTETPSGVEAASAESAPPGIGNDEVLEMANAQFSDSTILAVIGANPTRFDVSPRTLVALKSAGVSERVIEAMLAAETAKKQIAVTAVEAARDSETETGAAASQLPTEEFTKLSEMIERLAAQQEAAAVARREPDPPLRADPSPRAWIVGPADKTALAPTIAQVAFTDQGRGRRLETLQGLAGKALAFVNPGVSGIATTLGGLFVSEEKRTAVWALASTSAGRELGAGIVFEIEFAHIPGVDPDKYQPAIVQLVPTNDNYRLVAAAKTEGANTGAMPSEPIVEELVATKLTRIARGHYRAVPASALDAGEYALVLRPIAQTERRRRRNSETSLGELLGGGTSQILYLTWDFSVAAAPAATAPQAMVAPRSSN
jgi:hypothetical protein